MMEIAPQFNPISDDFLYAVGGIRLAGPGQMTFVKRSEYSTGDGMIVWMRADYVRSLSMKNGYYEKIEREPVNTSNEMYVQSTYAGPSSARDIPSTGFHSGILFWGPRTVFDVHAWVHAGAKAIPMEMDKESFERLQAYEELETLNHQDGRRVIERSYPAAGYPGLHPATAKVFNSGYAFLPQTAAFVQHGPHERTTVETEQLVTQQVLALVDIDIFCTQALINRSLELGHATHGIPESLLKKAELCRDISRQALPAYEILKQKGYVDVPEEACIPLGVHVSSNLDAAVREKEMNKWLEGVKALPLSSERTNLFPNLKHG